MIIYDSLDPLQEDADRSAEMEEISDLKVWKVVIANHPPSLNDNEVQDIMAEPLGSNYYYVHLIYWF